MATLTRPVVRFKEREREKERTKKAPVWTHAPVTPTNTQVSAHVVADSNTAILTRLSSRAAPDAYYQLRPYKQLLQKHAPQELTIARVWTECFVAQDAPSYACLKWMDEVRQGWRVQLYEQYIRHRGEADLASVSRETLETFLDDPVRLFQYTWCVLSVCADQRQRIPRFNRYPVFMHGMDACTHYHLFEPLTWLMLLGEALVRDYTHRIASLETAKLARRDTQRSFLYLLGLLNYTANTYRVELQQVVAMHRGETSRVHPRAVLAFVRLGRILLAVHTLLDLSWNEDAHTLTVRTLVPHRDHWNHLFYELNQLQLDKSRLSTPMRAATRTLRALVQERVCYYRKHVYRALGMYEEARRELDAHARLLVETPELRREQCEARQWEQYGVSCVNTKIFKQFLALEPTSRVHTSLVNNVQLPDPAQYPTIPIRLWFE